MTIHTPNAGTGLTGSWHVGNPITVRADLALSEPGSLGGVQWLEDVPDGYWRELADLLWMQTETGPRRRPSEVKGSGANANPEKHQRASDALYLATGRRRLTVEECARLQDFPGDHPWQGTKTARYRQVGNAVPPTLARVVAEVVLQADRLQ